MPKGDYIIPIIKGGERGVKSYANLKTKQIVKTGNWDSTPNCLVSEYCPKPVSEAYGDAWERVFGRRNNG